MAATGDAIGKPLVSALRGRTLDQDERSLVESALELVGEWVSDSEGELGFDRALFRSVEVAAICAALELDGAAVSAALFIPVANDREAMERVRACLGHTVANLVINVDRLVGIPVRAIGRHQAEQHRKVLVSLANDVRAIAIRLADFVQSMREIDEMPRQRQRETATVALDVYAPLAHRMGFDAAREELEERAFANLHPRKRAEIEEQLAQTFPDRSETGEVAATSLTAELAAVGIEAEVSPRVKTLYSIYRKMVRKGRVFNEIFDLVAMRVVVTSVKDCYVTIGVTHSAWKPLPGRFKDFVAMPKADEYGEYQALHTCVIGPGKRAIELQIQTREMRQLATGTYWVYKQGATDGGLPSRMPEWLERLGDWSQGIEDPKLVAASARDAIGDSEVLVFTPESEVRTLPTGATPIDFAYTIHTAVGDSCVGAEVNRAKVPLDHELRSGDICRIVTSETTAGPPPNWLYMVRTRRATRFIRRHLNKLARDALEQSGRELLRAHLVSRELPTESLTRSAGFARAVEGLGYPGAASLYADLGSGKVSARRLVGLLLRQGVVGDRWAADEDRGVSRGEKIYVTAWDRPGLFEDLNSAISEVGSTLDEIVLRRQGTMLDGFVVVSTTGGRRHVRGIRERLRGVPNVFDAHQEVSSG